MMQIFINRRICAMETEKHRRNLEMCQLSIIPHDRESKNIGQNMKTRTILNIFLFLFILSSCSEKEKAFKLEKGIAIITGQVSNLGENSKTIRFAAGGVVENIQQTAIIDSKGNFRVELELYHPQNIQGFFKKGVVKLYLRPSDSIHLKIDESLFAKEGYPIFEISGTTPDVEISKEIQQYLRFCGENSFNPDAKGKSVKEFHEILQKEINRQDSVLESFCKITEISSEFKFWAKKDIRYSVANYLLNYKFAHQNYDGDLFDKSLFPVNDDAAIVTSLYPYHLRQYALTLGIWQDTIILNLLKESKNIEGYQRSLYKVIDSSESGLSRDIMCYKLLLRLFNESFEDYEVISKDIDTYIENIVLKTVLTEKANKYKKQNSLDIAFLDSRTNEEREITGDFWNELKEKYKEKVVYVDIWATWCGPCKVQIPHAIELHEYFKGKDIAFVNLCLASNKNEWQKMIKNNSIKGDNYFFNKPQTQLLIDKLKFPGYPTYLIIDQQGNTVNNNAPRPSSGDEIRKLLNEWIEKGSP